MKCAKVKGLQNVTDDAAENEKNTAEYLVNVDTIINVNLQTRMVSFMDGWILFLATDADVEKLCGVIDGEA